MLEYTVSYQEEGRRTDRFLMKLLPKAPGSLIYKALRTKQIKVNDHRQNPEEKLLAGDRLQIYFSDERLSELGYQHTPVRIETTSIPAVPVVYEDDQVLLFNKPAGLLSQKDTPDSVSLSEYLLEYLASTGQNTAGGFRPGLCSRLDRGTSGIIAAGKTLGASQQLSAAIREHRSEKIYLALCHGCCSWKDDMWLCHAWTKDAVRNQAMLRRISVRKDRPEELKEGQVLCRARVLAVSKEHQMTLFSLRLITGKSHQLRSQLAYEGFSIIGDHKYRKTAYKEKEPFSVKHQLLHAYLFRLQDASDPLRYLNGRAFVAPPPSDFQKALQTVFPAWIPILSDQGENYV